MPLHNVSKPFDGIENLPGRCHVMIKMFSISMTFSQNIPRMRDNFFLYPD
jgi:hypothetical protein